MSDFYTIEIFRSRPARLLTWKSEDEALESYRDEAIASDCYTSWCSDNDFAEDEADAVWEYAAHDLQAFHRLTAAELSTFDPKLGGAQHYRVAELVDALKNVEIVSLDHLLELMREEHPATLAGEEFADPLPTFGGVRPYSDGLVWSWDEDRMLLGSCAEDLSIMTRKEWEEDDLEGLISEVCEKYQLSQPLTDRALELDPRSLACIGILVGQREAVIPMADVHEVTKWGLNWSLSRFYAIREIAANRK